MARGRMLSKSLGASKRFAATGKAVVAIEPRAAEFPQLLYNLLVPHTDDFGRQIGDAFTVKHVVFPTSDRQEEDFEAALVVLEQTGMILRYPSPLGLVMQVVKFEEHQSGLSKRTKSKFPEPPEPPGGSGKRPEVPETPGTSGNENLGLNLDSPGSSGTSRNALEIPAELNRTELNRTGTEDVIYGGADAPRFPRAVENSKTPAKADLKRTSTWKRALGIAHQVIREWPDHSENWSPETKERLQLQHMDPRERSPRGGYLFHDAVEYAIQQRRESGERQCGRPAPKQRRVG